MESPSGSTMLWEQSAWVPNTTMKLSSYKPPQSSTPCALFTSGYALNVFSICWWKLCLQVHFLQQQECRVSTEWHLGGTASKQGKRGLSKPSGESASCWGQGGRLPQVYPYVLLTVSSWLKSSHPLLLSVWAVSITGQWSHWVLHHGCHFSWLIMVTPFKSMSEVAYIDAILLGISSCWESQEHTLSGPRDSFLITRAFFKTKH